VSQWAASAHRGQLQLTILTRALAIAEGYVLHDDAKFLALVHPDGGDVIAAQHLTLATLVSFVREMAPRGVDVAAAPGEDADGLREAIAQLARSGAAVQ
jgi:hypothetical protein